MQDIAKAVGLKKQSLYSHFGSKEELYVVVLSEQSRILGVEIDIELGNLKDKSSEELLKGLFFFLVSMFSNRERLLLWKRTFFHFSGAGYLPFSDLADWHFDKKLKEKLNIILAKRHAAFADSNAYRSFFLSYMLMIQGYLDWMLIMGHDEEVCSVIWANYWNGSGSLFMQYQ